jgi:hypothetical protein
MIAGGCHCREIRYQAEGQALTHACGITRIVGDTPVRRWSAGRCTRKARSW